MHYLMNEGHQISMWKIMNGFLHMCIAPFVAFSNAQISSLKNPLKQRAIIGVMN